MEPLRPATARSQVAGTVMLEKLSLRYVSDEDRLLLTLYIHAADGAHQTALMITRRLAASFKADLATMLAMAQSEPQSAYQRQPPVKSPTSIASDSRTSGADEAPTTSRPKNASREGESALVQRIRCARRRSDGRWLLKFDRRAQASISLTLSDQALRDLAVAIQKHVDKANWALGPLQAPKTVATDAPPRALH